MSGKSNKARRKRERELVGISAIPLGTAEEAHVALDRKYFIDHPAEEAYVRPIYKWEITEVERYGAVREANGFILVVKITADQRVRSYIPPNLPRAPGLIWFHPLHLPIAPKGYTTGNLVAAISSDTFEVELQEEEEEEEEEEEDA